MRSRRGGGERRTDKADLVLWLALITALKRLGRVGQGIGHAAAVQGRGRNLDDGVALLGPFHQRRRRTLRDGDGLVGRAGRRQEDEARAEATTRQRAEERDAGADGRVVHCGQRRGRLRDVCVHFCWWCLCGDALRLQSVATCRGIYLIEQRACHHEEGLEEGLIMTCCICPGCLQGPLSAAWHLMPTAHCTGMVPLASSLFPSSAGLYR